MLRMKYLIAALLLTQSLMGQTPRIDNVQRIISFPFSTVELSGSGFSSNAAQLQVWFGSVKGEILFSTESSIRVKVPPQARLTQVEVIHTQSRRSARSSGKFILNFSGTQPFANNFSAVTYSNADVIFDLCSCDFDGDGKPDIVGSKNVDGKTNLMLLTNQSTVQPNNTTLAFTQTALPLNFPTFSVTCGDLNGDGKPEIVASRGGNVTGNTVYVFPNTSSPTNVSFGTAVPLDLKVGDFAKEVAIHDLNRDGRPDIVVTNGQTNIMYIFENQLTTTGIVVAEFTRHDILLGAATTGTLALDIADVSGDGWPDIITSPNTNAQKILVLKNPANGSLAFSAPSSVTVAGGANINDIASADFNNDGLLDIVVADRGSNKAFVLLNKTNLIFSSVNSSTGFATPTAHGVDVGDMNGDGFADFVIGGRDLDNPQVNIFINNGASNPLFTATKIVTPKSNYFVRVGDFDGDAKPDIAVTATNFSTSFSIDVIKNRNCHLPVILNDNPLSICNGQSIILETIPMKGIAFTWSTGDQGPSNAVTFEDTGTISVTAVGEGGACSTQSSIVVNPGAGTAPSRPTISGPDGVCAGSSLTLTTASVSGSPTYMWTGPNFSVDTNSPSVTVASSAASENAGTYSLVIKSGDCLSDPSLPKPITVIEPESFTISSSSGNTGICTGLPVTLSVNPVSGYNYQWKKGGTNIVGQTNPSLTINSVTAGDAGSYTVLISHQTISCSRETGSFLLSVFNAPVASFVTTPTQICVGTQVTFNGSASTVDGNATPSYAWEFGNSATGTGATTTHTYTNANPSIVVKLTVSYTGISSCLNSTTKTLSVNAATPPIITTDPNVTEICSNQTESVILNVSGTFNSYLWSVSANNTGSSITVKSPATYSVTTVDANNCPGTAEITLTPKEGCGGDVPPSPPIDISVPKVFSPNGDQANDFWLIEGIENYPDCTMSVFDGRGMRVYEEKGSILSGEPWNGRGTSGPVPDGTYYYVFGCPNTKPFTGSVLIVR